MKFFLLIFHLTHLLSVAAFSDWTPNYDYKFFNYSTKNSQPVGIAIMAFNRPEYLRQLIESIERNKQSQELPFFFFLDGGPQAKIEENIALINQSNIRSKFIIERDINYGMVKNFTDALRYLFDWANLEKVIVIEEDVVLSKNYFTTLLNLDEWAHESYDNVGSTQLFSMCRMSKKAKGESLNMVRQVKPYNSFVTFCINKKTWMDIASLLYEFEEKFIDPLLYDLTMTKARSKPVNGPFKNEIKEWLKNVYDSSSNFRKSLYYKRFRNLSSFYSFVAESTGTGAHDKLMAFLIWTKGYVRLETVVNRTIHIGELGFVEIHDSLNDIYLDEFEEDLSQHNFEYVSRESRLIRFLERNIQDSYVLSSMINKKVCNPQIRKEEGMKFGN